MFLTTLALAAVVHPLAIAQKPATGPYRIGIYGDHFSLVASNRQVVERYPLVESLNARPKVLSFRRDRMFATWDARGLTINNGHTAYSTKLEGIPVSPRLRKRDQILQALDGRWDLAVSAVSGGRRLGSFVYFVARWQRPGGSLPIVWLEALVRVNFAETDPRPEALAIVEGTSFSAAPVEDNLTVSGEKLLLPVHKGPEWGLWTYDTQLGTASYTKLGTGVKFAKALADGTIGFVEKTSMDSYVAGTLDPATLEKHETLESSEVLRFADAGAPGLVRAIGFDSETLHWLDDGRTVTVPEGARIKRGALAVVVWLGDSKPTKAWV
jgi:hypothetical protein